MICILYVSFLFLSIEFYSLNQNRERFSYLDNFFPGTIVTITINLADDSIYMLDEAKQNMIIF